MPVKIRLRRMGAKKRPSYRVVIADSRSPRDGRFIETIGTYNPLTNPPTTTLNTEKAQYWLSHGAQPTEAAQRILRWNGVGKPAAESAPTPPAEAEPHA
jgi:small subunit ribosomal protein S16